MEDANNLLKLFETFGTPGVLGGFLLWFGRWIKPLIETLVNRHIEFVDEIEKSQKDLVAGLDKNNAKTDQVILRLDQLSLSANVAVKKMG